MGEQRQPSFMRHQPEISRKLKAAEKRAKRRSRATEKPKDGTEGIEQKDKRYGDLRDRDLGTCTYELAARPTRRRSIIESLP